ncbi:MAG: porin family protein [Sulfurovum sp.]|nr:porin family protein [Sulfurovum sp.]
MKKTILTMCATTLLGTLLYAGGSKEVAPVEASIAPIMEQQKPKTTPFYIGGGIGMDNVSSFLYGPDTVYSGVLRLGYNYNKYIGVEARGMYGFTEGDKLSHDYSYGLYLKPQYPITQTWGVYGLLGYAQTKISFENEAAFNGNTNNYTEQSGVSFGAGVDYKVMDAWSVYLDAVRLIDESETKPEGTFAIKVDSIINLGVTYNF